MTKVLRFPCYLARITNYIQRKYHELNLRPRKCLGYKTPYEVYFSKVLHLA